MASQHQTTPLWTERGLVRDRLTADASADVCVVGAGIAGLTTAYLLAREGRHVLVLDRAGIGAGQTGRTSAHLSSAIDDRYYRIARYHGAAGARHTAESHLAAINRIEEIVSLERIDCDFRRVDGYLFLGAGDEVDVLEREHRAAHDAGHTDVTLETAPPLAHFAAGPALRFPQQARFHPLRYLAGLAAALERRGGRILTGNLVTEVQGGATGVVKTDDGVTVRAQHVVVATNSPINERVAIHAKQAPYLTYVIGAPVAAGDLADALYWDTEDPYHYIRLATDADGSLLAIVGGEDHRTGDADDAPARYRRLEEWARRRIPSLGAVRYCWSGQVMETMDGLAFIGRDPVHDDNVFVATGDSGMGLTHGTIAGIMLTDLIMGRTNPWASLYDPGRKRMRAVGEFLHESAAMVREYLDWLTAGDVDSEEKIPAGSGAIIRRGLGKLAIYRDPDGKLHRRSAVCPHLDGIVRWNSSEHTWDCPCHGSRFDAFGAVINGPAISGLPPAE